MASPLNNCHTPHGLTETVAFCLQAFTKLKNYHLRGWLQEAVVILEVDPASSVLLECACFGSKEARQPNQASRNDNEAQSPPLRVVGGDVPAAKGPAADVSAAKGASHALDQHDVNISAGACEHQAGAPAIAADMQASCSMSQPEHPHAIGNVKTGGEWPSSSEPASMSECLWGACELMGRLGGHDVHLPGKVAARVSSVSGIDSLPELVTKELRNPWVSEPGDAKATAVPEGKGPPASKRRSGPRRKPEGTASLGRTGAATEVAEKGEDFMLSLEEAFFLAHHLQALCLASEAGSTSALTCEVLLNDLCTIAC